MGSGRGDTEITHRHTHLPLAFSPRCFYHFLKREPSKLDYGGLGSGMRKRLSWKAALPGVLPGPAQLPHEGAMGTSNQLNKSHFGKILTTQVWVFVSQARFLRNIGPHETSICWRERDGARHRLTYGFPVGPNCLGAGSSKDAFRASRQPAPGPSICRSGHV